MDPSLTPFREVTLGVLEDVRLGREVVGQQKLKPLRERIGLKPSFMAELLHTSLLTYNTWERNPGTTLWPGTAARIGRFYRHASEELDLIDRNGVKITELMPLHHVATLLAVPQETLMRWYRYGHFEAEDLGILGLWIRRTDLKYIKPDGVRAKLRLVE